MGNKGVFRGVGALAALVVLLALPPVAHAGDLAPASFEPGPPEYPNVYRDADVPITMRDGVTLYADVYRPADANGQPVPGRFPTILNQIIFNKNGAPRLEDGPVVGNVEDNAEGFKPFFVKHGYAQVIVDGRGTGSSEGSFDYIGPEAQRDSMEVARWLVAQPFSDGSFAGYGPSCMAIYQLAMAGQRPPGLKALFPIVAMDDLYRDVTWHGGALDAPFLTVWHGAVTGTSLIPSEHTHLHDHVDRTEARLSPALTPAEVLSRPYDGDYYRERSPGRIASQVEVPTFVTGGWYDIMQRGTPRIYDQLNLPPGKKQLLMGPWYHLTGGSGLGKPGAPPSLDVLAVAWFDRWLKGERNGIEDYGPITVNQLGTDRWETYRQYPRADTRYKRFYLGGGKSGSAQSLNDGTLTTSPPERAGADAMPGNSVNGLCTRSTVQWSVSFVPPGQPCETDNRTQDATSLTYTTSPLEEPLHLSGPLSLTLNGSTTARDTTWVATVLDVAPDGRSSQITAGWLIQSRRALDPGRSKYAPNGDPVVPFHPFTQESVLPVEPGVANRMAVEIFNTDAVVAPGHRLRVTISSGDVPHLLAPADTTANSVGSVATVHRGAGSQSFLTAGVAPLGAEPSAATVRAQRAKARRAKARLARCRAKARRAHRAGKRRRAALARCQARHGGRKPSRRA